MALCVKGKAFLRPQGPTCAQLLPLPFHPGASFLPKPQTPRISEARFTSLQDSSTEDTTVQYLRLTILGTIVN